MSKYFNANVSQGKEERNPRPFPPPPTLLAMLSSHLCHPGPSQPRAVSPSVRSANRPSPTAQIERLHVILVHWVRMCVIFLLLLGYRFNIDSADSHHLLFLFFSCPSVWGLAAICANELDLICLQHFVNFTESDLWTWSVLFSVLCFLLIVQEPTLSCCLPHCAAVCGAPYCRLPSNLFTTPNHRTVVWPVRTVLLNIVVLRLSPGTGTGLLVEFLDYLFACFFLFQELTSVSADNCTLVSSIYRCSTRPCQFHYLIFV